MEGTAAQTDLRTDLTQEVSQGCDATGFGDPLPPFAFVDLEALGRTGIVKRPPQGPDVRGWATARPLVCTLGHMAVKSSIWKELLPYSHGSVEAV